MAVLEVDRVTKTYDAKRAVDAVSLRVDRGEVFALLGPNGAGKTSLIRMIMDITRPDDGRILLFGRTIDPALKDRLAYLPEDRGLYQRQKVLDVLAFLGQLKGLPRHLALRRAEQYLDRVGLLEVRGKRMRELSKGMQQKVQLAGVLLHEPELAILDEPFSGLDPVSRLSVLDLVRDAAARGCAILFSSHQMDQVESLCTRLFILHGGREVLSGTVREAREKHADNSVIVETDAELEGQPGVASAGPRGPDGRRRVRLDVPPEDFLAGLVSAGARVRHFERALPSLDEVFIRATGGAA